MNSKEYTTILIKKYGESLRQSLKNYKKMIVNELANEYQDIILFKAYTVDRYKDDGIEARPFDTSHKYKLKKYDHLPFEKAINRIAKSIEPGYNKTLTIIDIARRDGLWHELTLIPVDLFVLFWSFYENSKFQIALNDDNTKFRVGNDEKTCE